MATEEGMGGSGTVRVRVRPGARLKLAVDRFAVAGDWIDLHAADLAIASIRAQVETETDIAMRDAAPAVAAPDPRSAEMFNRLRSSARAQAETTVENRTAVARELATATLRDTAPEEAQPEPQQGKKKAR